MPGPAISTRKINVAMKLGNRLDLLQPAPDSGFPYSRISGWIRDAYIELCASKSFDQAEATFQFQTAQGQDTYVYPSFVRAIKAFTGFYPDGTPLQVDYKDIAYIRRYNANATMNGIPLQGPPSLYTAFGESLILRPTPDQVPYTFYVDYWAWPSITADVDSTPLNVPMDWLELLDYMAAVRGHAELQQSDRSKDILALLYGFTDPNTGRYIPGMIEKAQNRREASAPWIDYGMQPKNSQSYTR